MYWGPNRANLPNSTKNYSNQTYPTKSQTQTIVKYLQPDHIYQFTKTDEDHFKYLEERFLKGKQISISHNSAWMYKDQRDFRYKIYNLINEIAKKNNFQVQLQNVKNERDFYMTKGSLFQDLLIRLFQNMKTLKFNHTINILHSQNFQYYNGTLVNQVKKYTKQLNQLQKINDKIQDSLKYYKEKQYQLSIYKTIINSSNDHHKLTHFVSQYQKLKVFDDLTMQKLLTLTSRLGQYKRLLEQNSSNRWLKHFLAIVSQNFQEQKILSLQNSVNNQPNNTDLKNTMNTLKIYCSRRNKEAIFMEKLKKMTIRNYKTVEDVYQIINNIDQIYLKNEFQDLFLKQLAIQIIENQNLTNLKKNESYTRIVCAQYFYKWEKGGYQVYYFQKQLPELLQIKQRLFELEQIMNNTQKDAQNKKQSNFKKQSDVIEQILGSIQRMTKFLKDQKQIVYSTSSYLLKNKYNSLSKKNKFIGQKQTSNPQIKQKNIIVKNIEYIQSFKNDIVKEFQIFKQKCTILNQTVSKNQKISYLQIESIDFDNFQIKVSQILKLIQEMLKPYIIQQQKIKTTQITKSILNFPLQKQSYKTLSKNQSHKSQTNSIKQQMKNYKQLFDKNTQEKNDLENQLRIISSQAQKIKKQNIQLVNKVNKAQKYYQQWQSQWKKLSSQIQQLKTSINQKDRQIIDLKQKLQQITQNLNKKQTDEILNLKNQINQKQGQISNLTKDFNLKKFQIIQKENIISKEVSQKKILLQQKNSFMLKLSQIEIKIQQQIKEIQISQKILKQKQTQIEGLKKKETENQSQIIKLQERIKQLELQCQKLVSQKRVPNFRSFNTNTRQKSVMKKSQTVKKNDAQLLKVQQSKSNILQRDDGNKNKPLNELMIQKKDNESQTELIKKKCNLNFEVKTLSQIFIPQQKDNKKQHTFNEDNKKEQNSVILKLQKSSKQLTNLLNEKQSIITQLNQQISLKTQQTDNLNKRVVQILGQNQKNKEEIIKLSKSNKKLREQKLYSINADTTIQTLKKQKQLFETKLFQVTEQFQNFKNTTKQKEQTPIESDQIIQLQQQLNHKCNQITQMQQNIHKLSLQIQHLKNQNQALQKTLSNLKNQQKETLPINQQKLKTQPVKDQDKQKDQNLAKIEIQKKQIKMKIFTLEYDLQEKTQHYDELNKKYKKQTTTLKDKIQELTQVTLGLQSQIKTLKVDIQQKQQCLKSKEKDFENLKSKIDEFQIFIFRQKEEIQNLKQKITELKKENDSAENQLKRLNGQRNSLQSQHISLKEELRNEKKSHKQEVQKMKNDHAVQIKKLRLQSARQLDEVKRQIKSIQYTQRIKSNTQTSGQSNALMRMQFQKVKKGLQLQQKGNKVLQQQIKESNNQIVSLKNTLQEKDKQIKQKNSEVKFMKSSMQQLQKALIPFKGGIQQISTVIYDRFFQNQALYQQFHKKYLLYDLIQSKTKKTIKSTTLLYRLDFHNKVNFHNYIDGKQNTIVIVKTSNGNFFGGFSTSKIQKGYKQPAGTVSFIFTFDSPNTIEHFNINNEKKYLNVKGFEWDEYFFVFGNSQIRWRFGQKQIYSNFAIQNGFFETKGKNVSALLKQGNSRDAPIEALDFYQVMFEQ